MPATRNSLPDVSSAFITDELHSRPPKKTDYQKEKLALQDLASHMANKPEEVLPRFVDLAMEMTGAVSAGLSLYEPQPAPGVFRWTYLRGELAPFDGATTPRNYSPCGVTLDLKTPVLSANPERVYSWISDAKIVVPEVLLVPLYVGDREPLGTIWIVAPSAGHFDSGDARVMTELASFVGIALRMLRSEQRLHLALESEATLAKEMSHRVKNIFAVISGMLHTSARQTTTSEELAGVMGGRLKALATAHALVRRGLGDVNDLEPTTDLETLVKAITRPHEPAVGAHPARFSIQGPPINCGDHAVNGIALVLHELATNATKYGALKTDTGHIKLNWHLDEHQLVLNWTEQGGPPILVTPTKKGFGSSLTQAMVVKQFRGELDYNWESEGLKVTIKIPSESLRH